MGDDYFIRQWAKARQYIMGERKKPNQPADAQQPEYSPATRAFLVKHGIIEPCQP